MWNRPEGFNTILLLLVYFCFDQVNDKTIKFFIKGFLCFRIINIWQTYLQPENENRVNIIKHSWSWMIYSLKHLILTRLSILWRKSRHVETEVQNG